MEKSPFNIIEEKRDPQVKLYINSHEKSEKYSKYNKGIEKAYC